MRYSMLTMLVLAVFGFTVPAQVPKKGAVQRVVIPFDFESKFDAGEYGQSIGDMIWKKLERRGGFVIPESMLEIREWSQRQRFLPTADTPLARMKTVVRDDQGGDIGIWGKVERVGGADADVYDLWINIVDFSVEPPKIICQKKARTKTVSEIPHVYVKEALEALYGKSEDAGDTTIDPKLAQKRWEAGPNLVVGEFEQGKTGPRGWDPLPKHVSWVMEKGTKNHIVRFTIPPDVAETSGVLYYSDYFPIEAGVTYRFQCRWKSSGTAVKVFIKCYDEFSERGSGFGSQRREVYRSQQNLLGDAKAWQVHTEDFTPKHATFTPRWGRVMLYGYYPAGTVEWDDVVVKQIAPAPSKK